MARQRACAVYATLFWKTGAMVDFAEVDTLAAGYHQRGGQPGLAYGIVIGGELVHAGGLGERHLGGPPPDAGTVFRIASMTKSFTASAILALRDDGTLRLDDLAEEYVPELRDWPPVSPDSVAHLDQAPADHDRGLPDRRPVGRPAAGAAARGLRGLPGRRGEPQLGAGHPVRVLQPRLRDPGPGHHRGHRHGVPGLHPPSPADSAGHDAHRLRGRGVRGSRPAWRPEPRASREATGARRPAGPRWASTRSARSPRWAGSSAACATSPAGWPASRPRSRPGTTATRIRCARPAAVRCSCRRSSPAGPSRPASPETGRRQPRPPTASGCSSTSIPPWAGSSATAAATPGSAATWPGTRPPGPG